MKIACRNLLISRLFVYEEDGGISGRKARLGNAVALWTQSLPKAKVSGGPTNRLAPAISVSFSRPRSTPPSLTRLFSGGR